MSTVSWLLESLEKSPATAETFSRNGRQWQPIAGFRRCGSILAVYKDCATNEYCVHAGDDWPENQEPLLGYYDASLSWDDLIQQIAARYDAIRSSTRSS
jgi:hypothetical protein